MNRAQDVLQFLPFHQFDAPDCISLTTSAITARLSKRRMI